MLSRFGSAMLACLVLCACESPSVRSASAPAFSVEDSAGVQVVVNDFELAEDAPSVGDPTLQIGTIDGPESTHLFRVNSARRDADGRIFVANGGTAEILVFAADGAPLGSIGRRGPGPAEFDDPKIVLLRADTIWIQDRGALVRFTTDGDFVDRESLDLMTLSELIGPPFEGGGWQSPGTYVVRSTRWEFSGDPQPTPLFQPPEHHFAVDMTTHEVDTLGILGGLQQQFVEVPGGRLMPIVPIHARRSIYGAAAGRYVLADTDRPQFRIRRADGTGLIVRWKADPIPADPAEVDGWRREMRDARNGSDRALASTLVDVPEFVPAFADLIPASDGSVWISMLGPLGANRWVRFSPEGRFIREVRGAERLRLLDGGASWVLGVTRDNLDVEYLELYQLPPG